MAFGRVPLLLAFPFSVSDAESGHASTRSPEFGPPMDSKHQSTCGAGALAREDNPKRQSLCSADTPVGAPKAMVAPAADREAPASAFCNRMIRRQRDRGASRGAATERSPRRKLRVDDTKPFSSER